MTSQLFLPTPLPSLGSAHWGRRCAFLGALPCYVFDVARFITNSMARDVKTAGRSRKRRRGSSGYPICRAWESGVREKKQSRSIRILPRLCAAKS